MASSIKALNYSLESESHAIHCRTVTSCTRLQDTLWRLLWPLNPPAHSNAQNAAHEGMLLDLWPKEKLIGLAVCSLVFTAAAMQRLQLANCLCQRFPGITLIDHWQRDLFIITRSKNKQSTTLFLKGFSTGVCFKCKNQGLKVMLLWPNSAHATFPRHRCLKLCCYQSPYPLHICKPSLWCEG